MAEFVRQPGSAVNSHAPSQAKVTINARRHARIMRMLYRAKVRGEGLYKTVTMQQFAPQTKYFPGSPASQKPLPPVLEQLGFFDPGQSEVKEEAKRHDGLRAPRVIIPPGTLPHRRWLWFATLTDRREISDRVYYAHCQIFDDHPEFYSEDVVDMDGDAFFRALKNKKYKIGSPSQSAANWLVCAKMLFEEFDGDPVNLLTHAGWSVESVYAWKHVQKKLRGYDPIPGWGRKLISLYFLYLAELGYRLPEDAFPADVHAQAIMLQTGVVNFGKNDLVYSSPLAELVRIATTTLCKEKDYDVIEMAHASWLLGSQLCTGCDSRVGVEALCPVFKECGGRVNTKPYFSQGRWPKDGTKTVIPITPLFE